MQTAYALFETALGFAAVIWREAGIVGLHLPEADPQRTLAGVRRRHPAASETEPPPAVQAAVEDVQALLRGEPADLTGAPLDLSAAPELHRRVYEIARGIPPGHTLTYGEIAQRLGDPQLARAVGQALGRNPVAILVPCHRVLAAGGGTGGFSARGGVKTKLRLLEIEGALRPETLPLFDR